MSLRISLPLGLSLRTFCTDDQSFAEALFYSTREAVYLLPMPKQQVDLLLKQQFIMQTLTYKKNFPSAKKFIIALGEEPIGKIILNDTDQSLHVIDMALLQKMRGKGYGTAILTALKSEALRKSLPLRLAVDQQNTRAKKLYLSLGFTLINSSATHDTLMWH